tara:strand:+ start:365 stop:952 length:588 start_codon:yes stop_codon:yes gene_type:complete
MKYNLIELNGNNLRDFNNKIIVFNFNNYFNFLLKGYNNDKEIENQFLLDSYRNNIKYNSFNIKNIELFNTFLKNKYNYNILKKIYIISSQTMFSYIYKMYIDILPENKYLTELSDNSIKNKNIKKIKIFFKNDNSLNITMYKVMRIFQFDDNEKDQDLIYVLIIYNIDLENDRYIHCKIKYFNELENIISYYNNI